MASPQFEPHGVGPQPARTARPFSDVLLEQVPGHVILGDLLGITLPRDRQMNVPCFNKSAHAHGDATASLSVNCARGVFWCHACSFGGDIVELAIRTGHAPDAKAAIAYLRARYLGKRGGGGPAPAVPAITITADQWLAEHAARRRAFVALGRAEAIRRCTQRRLEYLGANHLGAGVGRRGSRDTISFGVRGPDGAPCGLWERDGSPGRDGRGKGVFGSRVGVIGLMWALSRYDRRVAADKDAVIAICEGESDACALVGAILRAYGRSPLCTVAVTGTAVATKLGEYASILGARRIGLFLDDDDAGRAAASVAADQLVASAAEVRVVALPLTEAERRLVDQDGRRVAKDVRWLLGPDGGRGPGDLWTAYCRALVHARGARANVGSAPRAERS